MSRFRPSINVSILTYSENPEETEEYFCRYEFLVDSGSDITIIPLITALKSNIVFSFESWKLHPITTAGGIAQGYYGTITIILKDTIYENWPCYFTVFDESETKYAEDYFQKAKIRSDTSGKEILFKKWLNDMYSMQSSNTPRSGGNAGKIPKPVLGRDGLLDRHVIAIGPDWIRCEKLNSPEAHRIGFTIESQSRLKTWYLFTHLTCLIIGFICGLLVLWRILAILGKK